MRPAEHTPTKMDELPRTCGEEDLLRIPNEILDELTPEQICLTPTIVCAYTVLEQFGSKLKPGDSVLLNAAHLSASGSALLQLCKLLKLKPLCMLSLPGRAPIGSNRCFKGFVNFVMFDGLTCFNGLTCLSWNLIIHHPFHGSFRIFPHLQSVKRPKSSSGSTSFQRHQFAPNPRNSKNFWRRFPEELGQGRVWFQIRLG